MFLISFLGFANPGHLQPYLRQVKKSGHAESTLGGRRGLEFSLKKDVCEHVPTSFLEVQTEPMLTKRLLSLVAHLVVQIHLFRICAE